MNATAARMTITHPTWSRDGLLASWEDSQPYPVAVGAANEEQAWLTEHTPMHMAGWSYDHRTGTFTGPADTDDAYGKVCSLLSASGSRANRMLPEIQAEVAQENAANDEGDGCDGHESLSGAHMGETVYCDGSCR
jgi:hypothetical protein